MDHFVPAYCAPCEHYWQAVLSEGPVARGESLEFWEWIETPVTLPEIWEEAKALQRHRTVLELQITGYNRGGLIASWQGIECFIPASHLIDYPFPADPEAREERFTAYLGQTLRLCLIEVEPARNRLLLSERKVAECELNEPEWPEWLCIGTVCTGVVTSVRPFGAFVDIGPLEGMIHISEISWGRVRHPEDFIVPGQEVRVKIISVDRDHHRVGLSLKRLQPNPWDTVDSYLSPGDVVTGTIAGVERFGIFVELLEGIEGLIHVSALHDIESPWDLNTYYTVGEPITVQVLDITPEEHRIALTLVD